MTPISRADFWSVCQGFRIRYGVSKFLVSFLSLPIGKYVRGEGVRGGKNAVQLMLSGVSLMAESTDERTDEQNGRREAIISFVNDDSCNNRNITTNNDSLSSHRRRSI